MAKYYQGLGRRKTATARVRLSKGTGKITVNQESISKYFSDRPGGEEIIKAPMKKMGVEKKFDLSALAKGGGKQGQVIAIQLGVARALIEFDHEFKKTLKKEGYLTRDPRMKERKKPGLKRARRAAQWQKR